jgi:CRP/FNR family cyclic AMP-dependent transcriptional regulator
MKPSEIKKSVEDESKEPFKDAVPSIGIEKGVLWLQRYALIARQPFFEGLSERQFELLADDALEMQFAPDQIIFQEGSQANRFFLILEGKVVLESETEDRSMIPIQTLGPGDDLGWSWLFPPYTLHFSARAVQPTRAIFFYGTRLRERCEADHDLGYELMKRIAGVVLQRLQAARRKLDNSSDSFPSLTRL